jgi:hypothetical protein
VATLPVDKSMAVYAKITDAQGPYTFRLDYVDVSTDRVLDRIEFDTASRLDRLRYYDLVLPVTVPLAGVGTYEFRLYANDSYLGRIAFTVSLSGPGGG